MINRFEYKEATPERKKELLEAIVSSYKMQDKAQAVQCLAHCQAVFEGVTQEDFSEVAGVSARTLRDWKKDYLDLYNEAYDRYTPEPELVDVKVEIEEDALESVYANLLSRLQNPKTATKDLAQILQYFNISGAELRQYASIRNKSLRGFLSDNTKALIPDEETAQLVKSIIAESNYLYKGTPNSLGNTAKAQEMDLDNPLVKLELMTFGMLFVSLFNGATMPHFKHHAETLRLLKYVAGDKSVQPKSYREFDAMDGKPKKLKPITPKMEQELVNAFGVDEGKEMYKMLTSIKKKVDETTKIKLPTYEDVSEDYSVQLKEYPSLQETPLQVILAKLDADADKSYQEKYKKYLENNQEDEINE
jgi:hypothetical protein